MGGDDRKLPGEEAAGVQGRLGVTQEGGATAVFGLVWGEEQEGLSGPASSPVSASSYQLWGVLCTSLWTQPLSWFS